jgi:hypothetical protein
LQKNLDTGKGTETRPKRHPGGKNETRTHKKAYLFPFTFQQIKTPFHHFHFCWHKNSEKRKFFGPGERLSIVKECHHPTEKSGARAASEQVRGWSEQVRD